MSQYWPTLFSHIVVFTDEWEQSIMNESHWWMRAVTVWRSPVTDEWVQSLMNESWMRAVIGEWEQSRMNESSNESSHWRMRAESLINTLPPGARLCQSCPLSIATIYLTITHLPTTYHPLLLYIVLFFFVFCVLCQWFTAYANFRIPPPTHTHLPPIFTRTLIVFPTEPPVMHDDDLTNLVNSPYRSLRPVWVISAYYYPQGEFTTEGSEQLYIVACSWCIQYTYSLFMV